MTEFKREPRYIVFKITDVQRYCSEFNSNAIMRVGSIIAEGRALDGKPPFNAVVVEQDWPEFEPVWAMIEARMTGTQTEVERQLAESQAREVGLREVLEAVQGVMDESAGVVDWHLNGEVATWGKLLPEVGEALADRHADHSALDTLLAAARKKERERCAKACEGTDRFRAEYFVAKIRALGDE